MTFLTTMLLTALAGGDCTKNAKNLLAKHDCGFATGIKGWESVSPAKLGHEPKDGAPTAGALKATAPEGSLQANSPCLPAKPKTTYRYGARFRLVSGQTYVCGPQIHHFGDAACGDSLGYLSAMADLVQKEWQAFDPARRPEAGPNQGLATTTADTKAIRMTFACSGEPNFTVLFDDVWISEK